MVLQAIVIRRKNECSRVAMLHGFRSFFEHVLQHLLVETQVSYELFKGLILLYQLSQSPQFRYPQAAVLFPPIVVRGLANTHLSAHLGDSDARVGGTQREHDFCLGKHGLLGALSKVLRYDKCPILSTLAWSSLLCV
jgi:hypothetical protein